MGDPYTLPASVSEFTKNGWEVVESSVVGSGMYVSEGITMKKDGVTAKFDVYNFSNLQVDAKNASIYKVNDSNWRSTKINLVLPGNIKLGSKKAEVEKLLGNSTAFTKEGNYDGYTYLLNGGEEYVKIWFSGDVVADITVYV